MSDHHLHIWRLLSEVDAGSGTSQRTLSRRVGIALGLTNLLLRQFVADGWVSIMPSPQNGTRYVITDAGLRAKAQMWRQVLARSVASYTEMRARLSVRLARLGEDCLRCGGNKAVAFLGAGEFAEIAYVSLRETDLQLVAVFDGASPRGDLFGVPVRPAAELADLGSSCRIVVTSLSAVEEVNATLRSAGVSEERVFWL